MTTSTAFSFFLNAIDDGDDDVTEATVATLTSADEPALIALAQSADPDQCWWALRALAAIGGESSLPAVSGALGAADPALRAVAAMSVAHLHRRVPEALQPLLPQVAQLLADDDGFVRQAAADGLAQCGDDAIPALTTVIFQSKHEGARTRAAGALRKIASMKAAGVLFRCLNDHNHLVHTYAYEALDEMGLLENVLLMP